MPGGFGFPLGSTLGIIVVTLGIMGGATSQPIISVVGLVAVIDAVAIFSTASAAIGTAVICWLLHAGFVLGRHGQLALTGQSRHDALVFAADALAVLVLVRIARSATALLHERENDPAAPRIPGQRKEQAVFTRSER